MDVVLPLAMLLVLAVAGLVIVLAARSRRRGPAPVPHQVVRRETPPPAAAPAPPPSPEPVDLGTIHVEPAGVRAVDAGHVRQWRYRSAVQAARVVGAARSPQPAIRQ
ncbi:MAG TPA: hypothetical protein VNS55_15945 [Nocardioides sp.]|nr:hypothetical protein [Nocardioides sp.]